MPYSIRKQKCKQSDGDSGSYTLSYTDKKGKGHSACHTSRKKARGQIAAIEGPYEGATVEIGETSLREAIRYLLSEADNGGEDRAPAQLQPEIINDNIVNFIWSDFAGKNESLSAEIAKLMKPKKGKKSASNDEDEDEGSSKGFGEKAVILALQSLGADIATGGSKAASDFKLNADLTISRTPEPDVTLFAGPYEIKTQSVAKSRRLAQLGSAKAISVVSYEPFADLIKLGRVYVNTIRKLDEKTLNASKNETVVGDALNSLKQYFEGKFMLAPRAPKDPKKSPKTGTYDAARQRWDAMRALQLGANAIKQLKEGEVTTALIQVNNDIKTALKLNTSDAVDDGDKVVKVVAELPTSNELQDYQFDPDVWDIHVKDFLDKRKRGASDDSTKGDVTEIKKLQNALRVMSRTIDETLPNIKKMEGQDFWNRLAEETQTESGVKGIIGASAEGFTIYPLNKLRVYSITQGGRLQLEPLPESRARSHTLLTLIRELVRHAK